MEAYKNCKHKYSSKIYLYPFSSLLERRAPPLVPTRTIRRIGPASSSEQNAVFAKQQIYGYYTCMSVLIRVTARSTKDIIFIFNSPHESTFRINEYIIKSENVHIKLKCNHAGVDFVPSETSHIIGPSLSSKVDSPLNYL